MKESIPRPYRFTEALNPHVDIAFKNLAAEIMKDGALSAKDKALIALACAVAVKCEQCVKAHKRIAMELGAKNEEILEAAAVAGQVRLGSGFTVASFLLE
jgi:AhpD family alkylhydroperoxidase